MARGVSNVFNQWDDSKLRGSRKSNHASTGRELAGGRVHMREFLNIRERWRIQLGPGKEA